MVSARLAAKAQNVWKTAGRSYRSVERIESNLSRMAIVRRITTRLQPIMVGNVEICETEIRAGIAVATGLLLERLFSEDAQ